MIHSVRVINRALIWSSIINGDIRTGRLVGVIMIVMTVSTIKAMIDVVHSEARRVSGSRSSISRGRIIVNIC